MELLFETCSAGGWRPSTRRRERPAAAERESCSSAQLSGVSSGLIWALSRAGATVLSIVRSVTTVYVRSGVGGLSLRARTGALSTRTALRDGTAASVKRFRPARKYK